MFCDQMTANFDILITFPASLIPAEKLLSNKFFDWKQGSGCDKMNALL
jgi:hypothetical protein